MEEIKVSVIVPVWNPGPGILLCVDSLTQQSLKEIEIIFVDDCGTDGAMDIVRAKALRDPRVRIIKNNHNIGAGLSRNAGIREAQGEFISFVDADDFVEKDFLELLYRKAQTSHSDIAKGIYDIYYEDGDQSIIISAHNDNAKIQKSIENHTPLMESFYSKFFTAIYRSSLFAHSDMCFGSMPVSEDTLFLLRLCSYSESIAFEQRAKYHYRSRAESISSEISGGRLLDYAHSHSILLRTLVERYPPNQYTQNYAAMRMRHMLFIHFRASLIPGLEKAIPRFCDEVYNSMLSLPFSQDWIDAYPELKVFAECKVALSLNYNSISKFSFNQLFLAAALVKQWVDFFIQYPDYYNCCEKRFIGILCKKPDLFTKKLKRKPSCMLVLYPVIQKELCRLPLRKYLRLSYSCLKHRSHTSLTRFFSGKIANN